MDKQKNQLEQANCSLLTTTQADTQSSNSSRKRIQSIALPDQKIYSRWVINREDQFPEYQEECRFLSVSKYYESLFINKILQKQAKIIQKEREHKQKQRDDYMTCFCGRKYKVKYTFQQHVIQNHDYRVESVEYLHNKLQLEHKYFKIAQLQSQQQTLLNRIKNSSLLQLFLPDQLRNLIKQKQTKIILSFSNKFLKDKHQALEKLDQLKDKSTYKPQGFFFTQAFNQSIRKIAIKYVSVFNRRISIFLRNSSYKDVLYLYIYNFMGVITQTKRYKKIKTFVPLSIIIQQKCDELLNWIDHNYKNVFEKRNIFYQHIQLVHNQKYTETERINKQELFVKSFLFDTKRNNLNHSKLEYPQFLLQNFSLWVQNSIQ